MSKTPRFPDRIPDDVTASDIDLDTEVFTTPDGERLTDERAEQIAARVLSAPIGRPSLTAPGEQSPALNVRVPVGLKTALEARAQAEGRRPSDVVREALEAYLQAG